MENKALSGLCALQETTVVEAMQKIDQNEKGILFIVDENGKALGSLTDGDIRRWLIRTGELGADVAGIMNRDMKFRYSGEESDVESYMIMNGIHALPILNHEGHIERIVFLSEEDDMAWGKQVPEGKLQGIPVIIMAGGKGTRLYPYTKILPKPLIPIGEIPILERILNRFYQFGAREFFLTVSYKKELIKSYFAELKLPYEIHYVEEDIPLGTAGSIRLINKIFEKPVIITNCDTLIEMDFGKILEYHIESENAMTVVSALKNIVIPYGVLNSVGQGIVSSIEEKPRMSYFINTGMYIVNPEYLELIPEGKVFHMTDLIGCLLDQKKQVGMYPISENAFLDMGEFEEMKKMEERINSGYID